ncbi:MAG: hypothetical protein V1701_09460 [Planctomycetota bacterium]
MKKLRNALVVTALGFAFVCGNSFAQNQPQGGCPNQPPPKSGQNQPHPPKPGLNQPDRQNGMDNQNRPQKGQEGMKKGPEGPNPGGPEGDNPKFQTEMKRHGETMKGIFEQIKALHEKIRKALESKIGEQGKPGPQDRPDQPNRQNQPGQDGQQGQQPNRPDNAGGQNRPDGVNPPKPGEENPDGNPKDDMIKKVLEPYRAEAEQIASQFAAEILTHHQNLLQIITDDQENIKNRMTENILKPPPPPPKKPQGQGGECKPNPSEKKNKPNCQGNNDRRGPPDKGDKTQQNDKQGSGE